MNPVSERGRTTERPGKETPLGLRWKRILLAGAAVHLAGVMVPAVLVPVYAILAGGGAAVEFAGLVSTWSLPVLTLPAAIWASRGARREAALNGLSVGLLVAGVMGVLFLPPSDPRSLALLALVAAAGLAGGFIGGRAEAPRR